MKTTRNQSRTALALAAVAMATLALAAASAGVNAALIHHWKLDGNANDSAGSHNGTLNGNVGFAAGQFGQAATFDGNGDRIVTGTDPIPGTNFTMAALVFADSVPDSSYVAGTQNSNDGGAFLRVETDRALRANVLPATNTNHTALSAASAVPLSDWTHVAMTVSSTGGLKIYVDGSEVASNPAGTSQLSLSNFTIGSRPDSSQNLFWNGLIDDVAVWNEVLTTGQLSNAMTLGAENYNGAGPGPAPLAPYTPDANTLHLWHLDETHPGPAQPDGGVAGSFNLTTANGASLGHASFPGFSTAGGVSGNDSNDGLQGNNIPVGDVTGANGAFTFEAIVNTAWLSNSDSQSGQQIISMEAAGGNSGRPFQFRIDDTGNLRFINIAPGIQQLDGAIPTTGVHAFAPGKWFHVAATYNGNENTPDNFKLYWTALDSSATVANEIFSGNLLNDLAAGAVLGVGNEFRSPSENLEGFIDEVRISDIARAPDDFLFAPGTAGVIPEPATMCALGMALAGLGRYVRKQRRA